MARKISAANDENEERSDGITEQADIGTAEQAGKTGAGGSASDTADGSPADGGADGGADGSTAGGGAAGGGAAGGADGSADGAGGSTVDGGAAGGSAEGSTAGGTDGADGDGADTLAGMENMLIAERDRYLRLAAEYDNFRKRSLKEREMIYSDAKADAVSRLLPVYDNLERALKMECADEAFYKGVEMTMTQLTEIFENMGVVVIKAEGEPFDPNRHNALMNIVNPELGEKIVAEDCRKGFMLGERVIRFSSVVVAN